MASISETEAWQARAIGGKLRAIRQRRQLSLRDLAQKAEVSASMLSQIENGKAYPSVRSLYNIAAALGVPVDYFFPEQAEAISEGIPAMPGQENTVPLTASEMREALLDRSPNPALDSLVPPRPAPQVVHAEGRPKIVLEGGVVWARLTGAAEPGVEFLETTYAPGATSGSRMSHHQGREFGLVLEGELVLELGFETHVLRAGDSIIFDSTTPHRLTNRGSVPMRAVWVVWG